MAHLRVYAGTMLAASAGELCILEPQPARELSASKAP